jgi:GGDEF domain-containing protein
MLSQWRNMAVARLSERFQRAIDEEDLPPHTNPGVLARYVITVSNGIAVQAASGADPDELRQVAAAALRNWPSP